MRLAASLALCVALVGCGGLPLGMLGGGPNVAANTQIGRENRQAVLSTELGDSAGRDIVTKEVEAGPVESLTVNNQDIPPWVLLLALIGWLLPTPTQMGNAIGEAVMKLFGRRRA